MYDAIYLHSAVCKLIANDSSLMKIIYITVTVKFSISAVSNETIFLVEGYASHNKPAPEEKYSTRMIYFSTSAIFVETSPGYSDPYLIPEFDTIKITIYDREMSYGQTVKPYQTTHNLAH